jgi:hypothetical protein
VRRTHRRFASKSTSRGRAADGSGCACTSAVIARLRPVGTLCGTYYARPDGSAEHQHGGGAACGSPDARTSLQPDVLVVAKDRIGPKNITEPLALAVEVLSPSTRRKDMVLKRSKYEDAGVASYWIVDPGVPSFVAYDLIADSYVEMAGAGGSETADVTLPFPVSVVPSTLV